jgi:glycosyltransferase involved in cell wall biosynthesis
LAIAGEVNRSTPAGIVAGLGEISAEMCGYIEYTQLPAFYSGIDLLAFPTHGDPHGLVVTEALACGTPVVATDSAGDIRNRLRSGRTGEIVAPSSPQELAKGISLAAKLRFRADTPKACRKAVSALHHQAWAEAIAVHSSKLISNDRVCEAS